MMSVKLILFYAYLRSLFLNIYFQFEFINMLQSDPALKTFFECSNSSGLVNCSLCISEQLCNEGEKSAQK